MRIKSKQPKTEKVTEVIATQHEQKVEHREALDPLTKLKTEREARLLRGIRTHGQGPIQDLLRTDGQIS